jgi:hypothetical protein
MLAAAAGWDSLSNSSTIANPMIPACFRTSRAGTHLANPSPATETSSQRGGNMGGATFGIGLPFSYPTSQLNPFASSPYGTHAFGGSPYLGGSPYWGQQQYGQQQYTQPLQQIFQILQVVPQQLQQVQQLQYVQQQQLQQLQQILQVIPSQLAQLKQLIQFVPQQIHQGQQPSQAQQPFGQQQSFGQVPPLGGFPATTSQWGISPQVFGPQPSHVM